jgi:DMATS type aromatic prenyltransferase
VEHLRNLVQPWANVRQTERNGWVSEISDDNTPIEFSVAMRGGSTDVRVLFEPQASVPTISAYRQASLALHDRLEREFGADLRRFRQVQDVFAPEDMSGPFAIWCSAVFSPGNFPVFKSYFNTQARGVGLAPALVEDALSRLGMRNAWGAIGQSIARRGPYLDELKYFALDLSSHKLARVKVYARHHNATPSDLEAACALQGEAAPGRALEFAAELADGGVLAKRASFTCAAFVEGQDRPSSITLYIPICAYAKDDRVIRDRVAGYLRAHGMDAAGYERLINHFSNRPLEAGVGMQSWIAIKRDPSNPEFTVYLSTEAYSVYPPDSVPADSTSRSVFSSGAHLTDFAARYAAHYHPLVTRASASRGGHLSALVHGLDHALNPLGLLQAAPVAGGPKEAARASLNNAACCAALHELAASCAPREDRVPAIRSAAHKLRQHLQQELLATAPAVIEELIDYIVGGIVRQLVEPPRGAPVPALHGLAAVHYANLQPYLWQSLDQLYQAA